MLEMGNPEVRVGADAGVLGEGLAGMGEMLMKILVRVILSSQESEAGILIK